MNLSRAATQEHKPIFATTSVLAVEIPVTKAIVARGGFIKMSFKAAQSMLHRWRNKGWILLATALVSFAAGRSLSARRRALNGGSG